MGWWITLGILVALAILPLGVRVRYNDKGLYLALILGPVRYTLVPKKKKPKKIEPQEETAKAPEPAKSQEPQRQVGKSAPDPVPQTEGQTEEKGGSLLDFLPLVQELFHFLGDFRRKLRVNHLELKLILAGGDPCNLALNYGRTWAAVGNLMPKLEDWFAIRKRDIEVECDFTANETLVIAGLDLTITLGRLVAAAVRLGVRGLITYLKIQKKRKGGAKQ